MRKAADDTFGSSSEARYSLARGHGGLKCQACHGGPHQEPHGKLPADCSACHETRLSTTEGGPHGMHPVGEQWVGAQPQDPER